MGQRRWAQGCIGDWRGPEEIEAASADEEHGRKEVETDTRLDGAVI
jgi:hypothetical protein